MKSYIFYVFLFSCFSLTVFAQEVEVNNSDAASSYETITLDGKTAYLHKTTKKIISSKEYAERFNLEEAAVTYHDFEEFWDTSKVNPYKGVRVEKPFLITFDDTYVASPLLKKMVYTSRFGRRRRGPHRGIDIDLHVGDPVRTLLPGKVRFVGYSRGHGRTVIVRHNNGLETVYAHLSGYRVKTNEFVRKGQILGLGGASGNARGSHLHLEFRYKGICINPEYLLDFENGKFRSDSLWVTNGLIDPYSYSSYHKDEYVALSSKEQAKAYDKRLRKIHVVKRGDTLWAIARRNGMRVNDLVKMNRGKISSKSKLRIGQQIIITP